MAKKTTTKKQDESMHKLEIYEKILDNVEEEIMLLDKDFHILWANKLVFEKYGEDIIMNFCYKITHGIDHICKPPYDICPIDEVLETGKPTTILHTHFDRKGNKIYVEVSAYPVYENDEITEFIHMSREVTERVMTEEKLKEQQQAMLALSTPVLQIRDQILVLPLIGTIDSARAAQIVEQLLNSIVNTQASIVIIDITGVPVIDTAVANHLIKTTQAAKMLGADTIITGISPANAQTLVTLGVDLSMMTTKGSLRSGVKLADGMLKLVVVEKR
jgi:anti-anti-sigma factor